MGIGGKTKKTELVKYPGRQWADGAERNQMGRNVCARLGTTLTLASSAFYAGQPRLRCSPPDMARAHLGLDTGARAASWQIMEGVEVRGGRCGGCAMLLKLMDSAGGAE